MTLAEAPDELDEELELEVLVAVLSLSSSEVDVAVLVDEEEDDVVVELLEPEIPDAPAAPVADEPAPVAMPLGATVARVVWTPEAVRDAPWPTAAREEEARTARRARDLRENIMAVCLIFWGGFGVDESEWKVWWILKVLSLVELMVVSWRDLKKSELWCLRTG